MRARVSAFLCALTLSPQVMAQTVVDSPVRGVGEQSTRRTTTINLNDLDAPKKSFGPPTAQTIFPSINLGLVVPQPLSLAGTKIAGLSEKNVANLAFHHLMVVQGSAAKGTVPDTMYAVYRENTRNGRANFVTSDVFVHGYFTYINTLTIQVVEGTLYGELLNFLRELKNSSSRDYKTCEIAEVKDDILRNLGFIIVAIKLLNPAENIPDMGGASDLAKSELELIKKGLSARSPIFNRTVDYAALRPVGYFQATSKTRNFYSAYSWLSRMQLSLTDQTNNTEQGGGNAFRRAVLLYRAIYLGKSGEKPLLDAWRHISEVVQALNQGQLSREPSIYVDEMNNMFKGKNLEFKDLLQSLAHPLSRAKLLISLKKQRPQGLDPTSIFDMSKGRKEEESTVAFRLFTPFSTVELDFLRELSATFVEEGQSKSQSYTPLALFLLFAMGSPVASNLLNGYGESLEPKTLDLVPDFVRVLGRRRIEDSTVSAKQPEKRWSILSEYFKPLKKGTQAALVSQYWLTQRLLSASGAFVDSYVTYDAQALGLAANSDKKDSVLTADKAGGKVEGQAAPVKSESSEPARVKAANFQYLEPSQMLYEKLKFYVTETVQELTRLNAMPQALIAKGSDLARLFDRAVKISEKELSQTALPLADFKLLAGIEQILPAISGPLSTPLYLPPVTSGGISLGTGDPGVAWVIFNTDQGPYLVRGAVYTYYEIGGGPFKPEHWERKKAYGFLRPPNWTGKLDVLDVGDVSVGGMVEAQSEPAKPARPVKAPVILRPELDDSITNPLHLPGGGNRPSSIPPLRLN